MSVSTLGVSPRPLKLSQLCTFLGPVPWLPWPISSTHFYVNLKGRLKSSYRWLITSDWFPKAPGLAGGVGEKRGGRSRAVGALLPHDKICFIYLTATVTLLQNPTISHHRAFLQGQLEWGCLATENKAGFHCREHTTTHKIIVYSRPGQRIWLKTGQREKRM